MGSVESLRFFLNGRTLACADSSATVRLWNVSTSNLQVIHIETFDVESVIFSSDGQTLASGSSDDDTIRLWDVATGSLKHSFTADTDYVNTLSFSPDGSTLATGSWDDTVRLWDVATGMLEA